MSASPDAMAAYKRRVDIVKDRLQGDCRGVASELLRPDAKQRAQGRWALPSPFRSGDNPTAFSIRVTGPKAGQWKDWVSGEQGNMLDLLMAIKGCTFKDAVAWAEDRYGLRSMTPEQQEATAKVIEKKRVAEDAEAAQKLARAIRNACHMFSKAEVEIEGTLVEVYLRSRGIDIRDMPNRDRRWLRFMPSAAYWMDPARPNFPVMMAGMVDGAGVMKACHLTFLRPDGRGKADVDKPKLMWPETRGLVIRLNNGRGNLDPEAAAVAGVAMPLLYGEGNEDGLSMAFADNDQRVWAASSLWNLANVPDHACASSYIVAQDNDWAKPQAQAGFAKGLTHIRSFGKPATAIRARVGKDFNDQLKGN